MSTEAALLRAIRDTPADDTARLVFADFVEEAGDPDRAEFVRVQVALARTPEWEPGRAALEDREHELLAANERRWLGVPHDSEGLAGWRFERGFLEDVSATPVFMLGPGADLCAAHPIRRWRVWSAQDNMPDDLVAAGRERWFARLEAVDLSGWYQELGELERFLTRSDFERLRELDLTGRPGLYDLPGILGRAPFREQLKAIRCGGRYAGYPGEAGRLDADLLAHALTPACLAELRVPGCGLTAQDVRHLLVSPCCRELTAFDIRDNHLEPDGWNAFRGAKCRLRELDLSGTPLGAIALDDVLRQESLSELRVLNLNRCGSAMANLRALAASRFWTQAEELRMRNGVIPEHSLEPLFSSDGPPSLRVLDVGQNYFRDAGVRGLCNASWSGSLTSLGLSQNYLTDEALRTIAGCGKFTQLRTLRVDMNNERYLEGAVPGERITAAGVGALGRSSKLGALRVLGLAGTNLTTTGITALVTTSHWRLRRLFLTECGVNRTAVGQLANWPGLAGLGFLDLGMNGVYLGSGAALMPLAESEYLSPLCELHVRVCGVDDETRSLLRHRLGRRLIDDTTVGNFPDFDL